jgi:hypothetical protein
MPKRFQTAFPALSALSATLALSALLSSLDGKIERARRSVGIDGHDLPRNPVFPLDQLWQGNRHSVPIDLGILVIHFGALSVENLELAKRGLQTLGHPDGYLGGRFVDGAPDLRICMIEKGVRIRDACKN